MTATNELDDFIDALRDPYWLVREHQRLETLRTKRFLRETDAQMASIERMRGHLGDPEHMLVQERRKAT